MIPSQDLRLVLAKRSWVGKKNYFFQRDLNEIGLGRDHFSSDTPTQRGSFATTNEPILDFLDTKSIATDALDTNLALFLRHLDE